MEKRIERLNDSFGNYEVSTNTLNENNLLEAYHEFLIEHYPGYKISCDAELAEDLIKLDDLQANLFALTGIGMSLLAELVNEILPNMLSELSPTGYYFGSNPGSSANIGFWPNDDSDEV